MTRRSRSGRPVSSVNTRPATHEGENLMTSKTFTVPNISCGHCTKTIEMEVADLAGVQSVKADMDSKQVVVQWTDPANWDQIKDLLVEINYPPAG